MTITNKIDLITSKLQIKYSSSLKPNSQIFGVLLARHKISPKPMVLFDQQVSFSSFSPLQIFQKVRILFPIWLLLKLSLPLLHINFHISLSIYIENIIMPRNIKRLVFSFSTTWLPQSQFRVTVEGRDPLYSIFVIVLSCSTRIPLLA